MLFVAPRLSGLEDGRGAWLLSAGDVALPPLAFPPRGAAGLSERLQLAFVESPLRPYQTPASYQGLLRRLKQAERRAGQGAPPDARTQTFEGGYGPNLASEVERYARAVAEIARREDFDVVHAHDWMTFPAGLAGAARQRASRSSCHVHACEYDRSGADADRRICAIEQTGLDAADASSASATTRARVLGGTTASTTAQRRVVHNAVTRREQRRGGRPERRSTTDRPVPRPRHAPEGPRLLPAARRRPSPRAAPTCASWSAATATCCRRMIERAARAGPGAARVLHRLPRGPTTSSGIYAEADVYVMPSVSEPFGIAPLEAMALDMPVIVSRQSGVAEVAARARSRSTSGTSRTWRTRCCSLLERPALREALVEAGQAEVAALRWESAEKLLVLYAALTGRPGSGRRRPAGGRTALAGAVP